jgi:hypothetical protein
MYGENSLGKRVQELQKTTKNSFISALTPYVSQILGDPDTISMRSIGGELFSEDDLYVGFLDLFNNPKTRQLAKDLIDYFYINGGSQKAREYAKFIPTGFMTASGYADTLRSVNLFNFQPILGATEEFLQDYIRNNPGKAPQLNKGDYTTDANGKITITSDQFTYMPKSGENAGVSTAVPYVTIAEKQEGRVTLKLYMHDGSEYVEIPRLGFTTSNYSGTEYGSKYSAIDSNAVKQRVQNPNTVQQPVRQEASVKETISNTTKVVTNNFEALNLDKVNSKEDIKVTLSIINNSTSRALLELLDKIGDLTLEVTGGNSSYKADENKVTIDSRISSYSVLQTKVLHEVTHAVTSKIINKILQDPNNPNLQGLSESQKLAYMRLNKTFTGLRQSVIDGKIPGLTKEGLEIFETKLAALKAKQPGIDFTADDAKYNPYINLKEFLAEAFSNTTFQKELDTMKFTEDRTVLQKLLEDIANFLNKFVSDANKDNVLAAVLYDGFTLASDIEVEILAKKPKTLFTVEKALKQQTFRNKPLVFQEILSNKDKPVGARNRGNDVLINIPLLQQKYEEKAWLTPSTQKDDSKATPLAEDTFNSFNEFFTFVLLHEIKHDSIFKEEGETTGQYEDRINTAALIDLNTNYKRDATPEDLIKSIPFDDLSVSLPQDLGMDNLEFMRDLNKEERTAYRKLLNKETIKVKCNG